MQNHLLQRLGMGEGGSMTIETAIVAPVLVMMSIGGFEISSMIARQHELQSAASEAAAIALVAAPHTAEEMTALKNVLKTSVSLEDDGITLIKVYRCGNASRLEDDRGVCAGGETISAFVRIRLTESHTPVWAHLGLGDAIVYDIRRTVQLS